MDTSARTRVQGCLSLTDDPPEYKEDPKPPFRPREGYHRAQQECRGGGSLSKVKCYNCDKMGHFACDCRAPRREHQWRSEKRQGQSWGRMAHDEEERDAPMPDRAKGQSRLLATRSSGRRRQGQKHDSTGPCREKQGFSQRLNPMAWVRALRCNSVYVMCFRSMRIPVSI
jgi:hypothetical protein